MEPDIRPLRMTPIDVVALDNIEIRAVLVHLAGHEDPVVAEAVVDVVQKVLTRTRCESPGRSGL